MIDANNIADIIDRNIRDVREIGLLSFLERMGDLSTTLRWSYILDEEDD
jgi:hypothetical protein